MNSLVDSPTSRPRQLRQLAVLILTAILGFTFALASATPAQAASGYTITGVVTGLNGTGTVVPLADAYLYAEPVDWEDPRNIYGTVDAAGRFTIDVGEPGEYTLYANCQSGTACAATYADQYFDKANGHADATPVVVSTTTAVTANMRLPRWATVKGKVTSTTGTAIAGITVESSPTSGGSVVSTTTDATGSYTLAKVMPGKVQIAAREERGQHNWTAEHWNGTSESTPTWPNPSPVLPAGPTVTTANFQLAQTSGFYGEAVDSAGAPIQGVGWTTYTYNTSTGDWDTPQYGPRMTDENGKFFWNTAVGGRYKVCFDDTYYGPAAPVRDLRYGSRCWDNAADSATATVLTQPATPLQRTLRVVLPTLGKSLTASDPWIDGVAKVGSPLKVYPGAWGPTGVQLAYQWGWYDEANGFAFMPVTGATATTYTPTADLAGKYVAVRVTGTLAGYATAQMLAGGHGKVGESGVALTSPLKITGTPAVGQVLTATHGTPANGDAIDYDSYEWRVGGESAGWDKTLTLTSDMVGKTVNVRYYVRTTSSNSDTTYVATAGPVTAPLGTLTAPTPTISGTAKAGSTLTAVPGTWGPAPVTLAYQWKRAGVAISGATASIYVLTGSDTGKTITVTVTGTKSGYTTAAKTSAATAAVAAGTLTAPTPTISGSKTVGQTLTAVPGTWGPAPITLAYQWYRSGVAITGATASTYVLTATDQTKTMTVRVTGTKTGYTSVAKTSVATTAVLGALTAPTPTTTGNRTVGSTLTAVPGTWGPAPVTLAYQWFRSGVAITGATASTYKATSADLNKTMSVRVTGTKSGYTSVAKTSAATSPVLLALTTAAPTITGTVKAGYRLTASPGTWGPAPVTLAYQWNRTGVAITGASANSYVLTGSDTGKAITVTVTGTKSGYTSVARTSAATAAVAAGTLTAPTPTITGTKTVGSTLTATPGTWGPAPVTLAYQWYRSGVAITGATASTFALTTTDRGKTMSVRVTGTKTGYTAVAKTSAATTAIL